MSEAPKKIWIEIGTPVTEKVEYIRSDLVDGLVKALEDMVTIVECSGNLATNARAALKALEEE